ncbi:MAG TPA: metallopeptidase TldD-related protein [Actinocrinis sp.]|uniref:metallopeptidase TldD-related protein n=1 Tax=Actinocrinis sp. TaxID=1920516 RepID=UPI002DDCF6B3|nr:metallopeptidase TldD-related protein [Actinocrinis sp.]HEV3171813.1 metallopeptidase TldD-related protein [Actinocrinis sp.]
MSGGVATAQELAERALELSRADGAVVLVDERSTANLRWANNTLTTNGVAQSRNVTVVSTVGGGEGVSAAVLTQAGVGLDTLEDLVRASERAAREAGSAEDARPLLGADSPELAGAPVDPARWAQPPAGTSIEVFGSFAPALGQAFEAARAGGRLLFGFAEHTVESTYLATSAGLRLKHDQPTGKLELNAKSPDFARSAWAGAQSRDFTDVDVVALSGQLGQRLDWQKRRIELPAGRYETLLPPSAVADLYTYQYWVSAARDAADGRTVFSTPGGSTKVGSRIGREGLRIWSDPSAPGLECAPFNIAHSSSSSESVFDNGLPLRATDWVRDGVLEHLLTTRQSAERTGLALTPPIDNLLIDGGGTATLEEMTRATERGLLLTCLWYIREVDPQTLLLTGLTRDGVYLVEGGEVTGVVNNFRFNESPVDLLARVSEVGRQEICLPREWNDYFTRAAVPAFRVADFNMSSVSQAS